MRASLYHTELTPERYVLQTSYTGMFWTVEHPDHLEMTLTQWLEIEAIVRTWTCRWRLLKITKVAGSDHA